MKEMKGILEWVQCCGLGFEVVPELPPPLQPPDQRPFGRWIPGRRARRPGNGLRRDAAATLSSVGSDGPLSWIFTSFPLLPSVQTPLAAVETS